MKPHTVRMATLATALGLLLPATCHAQFFFPFFGFGSNSQYRNSLYNRSFLPIASPYMNPGLSAFSGAGGYGPGAYNPLLYNASFNPTVYNPTPSIYNPAVYNAAFNPNYGQAGGPAYAVNSAVPSGTRPAIGPAVPSDRPRPLAVKQGLRSSRIEILLPTGNAKVTLQGVLTKQTGTDREFRTPPLDPSSDYTYEVVVRWRDAGGSHTQTRHVRFWGGQDVLVDFRTGL